MSLFEFEDEQEERGEEGVTSTPAGLELLPACQNQFCIAHAVQEEFLLKTALKNKLPHAMIFSGPSGIGKSIMAMRLIRFLLSGGAEKKEPDMFGEAPIPDNLEIDPQSQAYRLIASESHPDMRILSPEIDEKTGVSKNNLDVDTVRKEITFLKNTPSLSTWRAVMIDDAHLMNRNAQNALLKILEEPPKKTMILLITQNIGALLPTIRSRAQILNFKALNEDNIRILIQKYEIAVPDSEIQTLIGLSEGSFSAFLNYKDSSIKEQCAEFLSILSDWPEMDWTRIHGLSEKLAGKAQEREFSDFIGLVLKILKDFIKIKLISDFQSHFFKTSEVLPILDTKDGKSWIQTYDDVEEHFKAVDQSNLDKKTAILKFFALLQDPR